MGHGQSCLGSPLEWKQIEKSLKDGDFYHLNNTNSSVWVEKLDIITQKFEQLEKELKLKEEVALFDGLTYKKPGDKVPSKPNLLSKEVSCKKVNFDLPKKTEEQSTPSPKSNPTVEAKIVACKCGRKRVILGDETVTSGPRCPPTVRQSKPAVPQVVKISQCEKKPTKESKKILIRQEDGMLSQYLSKYLKVTSEESVVQWLRELRDMTEEECVNALRSKGLTRDTELLSSMAVRNARDTVFLLQKRADAIAADFATVVRGLEEGSWIAHSSSILALGAKVQDLVKDYQVTAGSLGPVAVQAEQKITDTQEQLQSFLKCCKDNEEDKTTVLEILKLLGEDLKSMMEALINQELSVILGTIKKSDKALQAAALCLAELAESQPLLADLAVGQEAVEILASRCCSIQDGATRRCLLRALTWLCGQNTRASKLLERAGGAALVAACLADSQDAAVRCEAAAVLATAFSELSLESHVEGVTASLLDLAVKEADCSQNWTMATAALAKLAERWPERITAQGAANRLAAAYRSGAEAQLAIILGCQPAATLSVRALELLARDLLSGPSPQPALVAVARLASDPALAARLAELGVVARLVTFCRGRESDVVLLAALAALRRLAATLGTEEIEKLKAMDLVKPRLWDSFVICTSRQESYV